MRGASPFKNAIPFLSQAAVMKIFSSLTSNPSSSKTLLQYAIDLVLSLSAMSNGIWVVGSRFNFSDASSIISLSGIIGVLPKYPRTIRPYPGAICFHGPNITFA